MIHPKEHGCIPNKWCGFCADNVRYGGEATYPGNDKPRKRQSATNVECPHLGDNVRVEGSQLTWRRCKAGVATLVQVGEEMVSACVQCSRQPVKDAFRIGKECGKNCKGYPKSDVSGYAPTPTEPGTPWPIPRYGQLDQGTAKLKSDVASLPVYRSLPAEAAHQSIRIPDVKRAAWWAVAGDDDRYYRYLQYSVESFLRHNTGWAINIAAPSDRIAQLAASLPQATMHALRDEDILHVPQAVNDYKLRRDGAGYAIHIPTAAIRLRMIVDNPDDTTLLYTDCDVVYRRSIEPLAMKFESSGCAFAIAPELHREWVVTNDQHWRGDAWRNHYKRSHEWGKWTCLNTGLLLARGSRSSIISGQCYDMMKSPIYDDMKFGEQTPLTSAIWDDDQPFFQILPEEHVIGKNGPHYDCIAQHYCGVGAKESLDREMGSAASST